MNSVTKLTASNGGVTNYFGNDNAVAMSNNRIVVGAPGYDDGRGAVYLFGDPTDPQSGRSYSQLAIVMASDHKIYDSFGESVAMEGDIIVVGATGHSNSTGAVFVFRIVERDNTTSVSQLAKLTAYNATMEDASNGLEYYAFGQSVAIHGIYILVGAAYVETNTSSVHGTAYLFGSYTNDTNTPKWTQLTQFQPDEQFDFSVAMDENIAVIGISSNAAYVFAPVNNNNTSSLSSVWTQVAKLTGSRESIGSSVAVAGNWIFVGTDGENGAIYGFSKNESSLWTEITRLLVGDHDRTDDNLSLQTSVSVSKDLSTVVVGAFSFDYSNNVNNPGAAYLFRTIVTTTTSTTLEWTQTGKFVATDWNGEDYLGSSLSVENNIVVIGTPGNSFAKGAVYVVDAESGFSSSTQMPEITSMAPSSTPARLETDKSSLPPGAIVGLLAVFVLGGVAALITILNYRVKIHREAREQQQQHATEPTIDPLPPPSSSISNIPAPLSAGEESLVMPDVVFMSQGPVDQDRTMEGVVFNPTTATVAHATTSAHGSLAGNKFPLYKDQVRDVEQQGTPANTPALSQAICYSPQQHHDQQYQEDQSQSAEQRLDCDAQSAVVGEQQQELPSYKNQVAP
jgi:hypothetical protein